MIVQLDSDGSVLNTFEDGDPNAAGEWFPDDTVIRMVDMQKMALVGSGGVMRIMPPRFQADDWPQRAARQWDSSSRSWQSTGGQTSKSEWEKAVAMLRDNEVPDTITNDQAVKYFRVIRLILLMIVKHLVRWLTRGNT